MRSSALLRLTLLVVTLGGAGLLGVYLFGAYWGDVRRTVAYELVREARSQEGAPRQATLEAALAVDPDNWLASLRLGEDALFAGKLDEAERYLDAAVRGNPQSPLANYTMGVVQFRRGSAETALPYFEAAARLDPGNLQYEGMVKQVREALSGGSPPSTEPSPGFFHGGAQQGAGGEEGAR